MLLILMKTILFKIAEVCQNWEISLVVVLLVKNSTSCYLVCVFSSFPLSMVHILEKDVASADSKDWPAKKVTIFNTIVHLVKTSENILFFCLHFT